MGLKWKAILTLDAIVDNLFCVRTVAMEREVDAFLNDVIRLILATLRFEADAAVTVVESQFIRFFKKR